MKTGHRRTIDVNADVGEGAPFDAELLAWITSANVSCGAHAGDATTIIPTLGLARAQGVFVGAHPGYRDPAHFGRMPKSMTAAEVEELILTQCGELSRLAEGAGTRVRYLKPHGALYNQAQTEREIATGVLRAAERLGLPVLGQPGGVLDQMTRGRRVRFVAEGFADRRYRADGRLVPRSEPEALIQDPDDLERHAAWLIEQGFETLCVHGDHPECVAVASRLRGILDGMGVEVRSFLSGVCDYAPEAPS